MARESVLLLERLAESIALGLSHRKAMAELQQSEERFRKTFEDGPLGMALWAPDFKLIRPNAALCKMLGYTEQELAKHTLIDLTYPEDLEKTVEFSRQLANGELSVCRTEKRYIRKDGELVRALVTVSSLRNIYGEFLYYLSMVDDITERTRLETQARRVQRLEGLGLLAGGIAHDFNNLLCGVFGCIEMALLGVEGDRRDEVATYLRKAFGVLDRARALNRQLIGLAKGGKPALRTVSLVTILRETPVFSLVGSNITPVFDVPPSLWSCDVDEQQIAQVVENIVINARQAMPGGGHLFVTAENVPMGRPVPRPLTAGDYVKIKFRDEGAGLSEAARAMVFAPFFTTKEKGTGLGLSMSQSIVKRHKGLITVDSVAGSGATFTVYLPATVSRVERNGEGAGASGPAVGMGHGVEGLRGKVLLMDDEEFMRESVGWVLEEIGYRVEFAENGQEALTLFEAARRSTQPFDVVLLDLTVRGGMGGLETIKRLKVIDPFITAIASSGYEDDPVLLNPQAFGFADKLAKPYTGNELEEVLRRLTHRDFALTS